MEAPLQVASIASFTQVIRIFAQIYALLCSQKDKIRDKNNSTII